MKNMKIRTKLIGGFLIVAILTMVVGVVGIYNLDQLNLSYTNTINSHAKPLDEAGRALAALEACRAEVRGAMLFSGSPERVSNQNTLLHNNFTKFEENATLFGNTLVRADAKKYFDDAMKLYREGVVPSMEKVIEDASNGVSQEELTAFMVNTIKPAIDTAISDFESAIDTKTLILDEATAEGSEMSDSIFTLLLTTLILSFLVCVALGLYLVVSMTKQINTISSTVDLVAAGDFTVDVHLDTRNELGILASRVDQMIVNLRDVLHKVNEVALIVDDTSRQVASSSMSLAQISTEQAGSSQEISASMLDITNRTRANSENADKASRISDGTKEKAAQGNNRMNEMLKAMQSINDSSANISNIIKVIDDIAFQTNILALNAAVEAARAGTHGKGFAVVAEEVRNLAARSATAASETTNMIENSIKEVEKGTVIAKETAVSLKEIVQGVADTADLIQNISEASRLQSDEASQISGGMDQVSQAIQTTSSVAEEAASSSSELSDQSAALKDLVSKFRFSLESDNAPRLTSRSANTKGIETKGSGVASVSSVKPSSTAAGRGAGLTSPGYNGSGRPSQAVPKAAGSENSGIYTHGKTSEITMTDSEYGKY